MPARATLLSINEPRTRDSTGVDPHNPVDGDEHFGVRHHNAGAPVGLPNKHELALMIWLAVFPTLVLLT